MMDLIHNITLRDATAEDLIFIVDCQLKMAMETEQLQLHAQTVTQGVKSVLEDALKGFYLIGVKDSTPCSCLMITPEWSDWRNNLVWWIQSVYVLPEFRKQGIFNKMYEHVKSIVMQRDDVAGLRLYVDHTNLPAQQVYKRVGMTDEHYRLFEWMK